MACLGLRRGMTYGTLLSYTSAGIQARFLQDDHEANLKGAKKAASLGAGGKLISDPEMAERLTNLQKNEADTDQLLHVSRQLKGRDGKHTKCLREGRSKPHKAAREGNMGSGHKRKRKQGRK